MHFSIIREHREFFRNNQWIECDDVVSPSDLKRLSVEIPLILAKRKQEKLLHSKESDVSDFAMGHDLWRENASAKKTILSRRMAGIASELTEKQPLRFGYDMLLPAADEPLAGQTYTDFLKTTPTLEEMSCIQGVIGGAFICLSCNETQKEVVTPLFSPTPGNAVFVSPKWPLPLGDLYQRPGCSYLLVVYVQSQAVYLANHSDPHLHDFRQLGYDFGDRLKEPLHPIVYESSPM